MAYNHGRYTTLEEKLKEDLLELKKKKKLILPMALAKKYKTGVHKITETIRHFPNVYKISNSSADRSGYKSSVWGFKEDACCTEPNDTNT